MNWADWAIIAVLALSVLVGLWRGLVSEALALAIWAAALWAAWAFGPLAAEFFATWVDLPSARLLLGYAGCFLAVLLLGALLRFVMRKLVQGTGASGSDRLLGMAFGLVRGVLLVVLIVSLLGFTPFPRDPWWQESQLLPSFAGAAEALAGHLPEDVGRYLDFSALPLEAALGVPARRADMEPDAEPDVPADAAAAPPTDAATGDAP